MRIAGIDIGSNTSLLLIAEKTEEGFEVLTDKLYFTRLAEGIEQRPYFSESALSRMEQALSSMKKTIDSWRVDNFSIVATSASRVAKNKNLLFELGEKYALSPIEIISPIREAELTFIGALFGLGYEPSRPLVVDIGGGSTELISLKKSYSLNIGSVVLTEKLLNPKALSPAERLSLHQHIQLQLKNLKSFLSKDYDRLIFVAGTPVTLSFLEKQTSDSNKVHGLLLTEDHVHHWLEKLSRLSVKERKKVPHLPEHKADVIVAGLILLKEILSATGKKDFIISAGGVRYGLVLEQFQQSL